MRAVGNLQPPPEGTGPPPTWKAAFHDALIVITDITGFRDDNLVPAPRMPIKIEPDGIACDGLREVDDGAMLLVRIVADKSLDSSCKFGYIPQKDAWAQLPEDKQEGEYIPFKAGDKAALKKIGIAIEENEAYEAYNKLVVKFAAIYKPPVEFDLKNSDKNKAKSRDLTLAARLSAFGDNYLPQKTIMLVRTPLVLVHGINSSPKMFDDWKKNFEKGLGFICGFVDHSDVFNGNGDVQKIWERVPKGIDELAGKFRNGSTSLKKRIAVQKCDIAAHSYGGILARWYTEKAGVVVKKDDSKSVAYEKRKDVRKLITMCTPHRGTPVCNLTCEAYLNPLIYYADTKMKSFRLLGAELQEMHDRKDVIWYIPNGNPLDGKEKNIVPSLRIMSVNSALLDDLNREPFKEDIAYAAIVGNDSTISFWVNLLNSFEPFNEYTMPDRSYFPWYSGLDGVKNKSDGVVPIWSQILPAKKEEIVVCHTAIGTNAKVRNQVRNWLNDSELPRGIEHRDLFVGYIIADKDTRKNAYIGSNSKLENAGFEKKAIVLTQFQPYSQVTDLTPGEIRKKPIWPILGAKGGLVKVICTGMADKDRTIDIMDHGIGSKDRVLQSSLKVVYAGTAADQAKGTLFPFSATGFIGRAMDGDIIGKNGYRNDNVDRYWIKYKVNGEKPYANWVLMESPVWAIDTTTFVLPPLEGATYLINEAGANFKVKGAAEVKNAQAGKQPFSVTIRSQGKKLLDTLKFYVAVPYEAVGFARLLLPFAEKDVLLFKDKKGFVAGRRGSSGKKKAEVQQWLEETNTSSTAVTVEAMK